MTTRAFVRRSTALAFASALLIACNTTAPPTPIPTASPTPPPLGTPTPKPSVDVEAMLAAVEDQVVQIRGLPKQKPVEPSFVTKEQFDAVLRRLIDEDTPPELLQAYEDFYHALGLMDPDQKLADVFIQLLQGAAAGLYVPEDEALYVLTDADGIGAVERVYFAHEFDHALQDQTYDLEKFQPVDLVDQTDLQLARQALVEGDAYVLMTQWLQQHLTPDELGEVIGSGGDLSGMDGVPPIVVAQQLFPALYGWDWATRIQGQGGWEAINAAWFDPPATTEQILHPEKWSSREPAIAVALPEDLPEQLGTGWTETLVDTMGEYQLGVWITGQASMLLPTPPPEGAIGWGGDRVALYQGPDGAWVVAGRTEWDTVDDAAEFESALAPRLEEAGGPGQILPGEGGTVRWYLIASDDPTLARAAGLLGLAG
jgi:hypothetical protein